MPEDQTLYTEGDEPKARKSERKADYWRRELAVAEKECRKFWERGRRVIKKYTAEYDDSDLSSGEAEKFNIFWSNVGILKAALYANPPKPVVKREFDDFQDQPGRVASIMMGRILAEGFEDTDSSLNTTFKQVTEDRLIPGLGQVWLRYEPVVVEVEVQPEVRNAKGKVVREAVTTEEIESEDVAIDYVYWEDFLWSPCRVWTECRWVARRVYMNKKKFTERFGETAAREVAWKRKLQDKYGDRVTPEDMGVAQTEVYEIWCKTSRTTHWVSKTCAYELDTRGDTLELPGFFPCPKPLFATTTTSTTVPKADYLMVQSQYRRLENLTVRIRQLEDAIQASGVYDSANKEIQQLLNNNRNKLIPVENWGSLSEKGGIAKAIDWFPLEMVVNALDKLREMKTDAKAELFELTGISDIMRGVTNARETAQAQGLKAQYSSVRLQFVQDEVANFVQETLRLKGCIICRHFQPENIIKMSKIELTPDADLAEEAVAVLKDKWESDYRVKIYADTLSIPDYNAEQRGRTEFVSSVGQFISMVTPLVQMEPGVAPFLMEILRWAVSSFRSAQSIEGVFTKALAELAKSATAPKPEKPDPALIKANAAVQAQNMKTQADIENARLRTQSQVMQDMSQAENAQMKVQAETAAYMQKVQADVVASVTKAVLAAMEHRDSQDREEQKHQQTLRHAEEAAKAKAKVKRPSKS